MIPTPERRTELLLSEMTGGIFREIQVIFNVSEGQWNISSTFYAAGGEQLFATMMLNYLPQNHYEARDIALSLTTKTLRMLQKDPS